MMVVQCEQCRTRFKLDDSKVGDKGVKVRCSKCRHIFLVSPERGNAAEEPDFDALFTGLGSSPASSHGDEPGGLPDDIDIPGTTSARGEADDDGQTPSGPGVSTESGDEGLEIPADNASSPFSADEYAATLMTDTASTASNSLDDISESPMTEKSETETTEPGSSMFGIPVVSDSRGEVGADSSPIDVEKDDPWGGFSSSAEDGNQGSPDFSEGKVDSSIAVDNGLTEAPSGLSGESPDGEAKTMLAGSERASLGGDMASLSGLSPTAVISVDRDDSTVPKPSIDTNLAADEPPPLSIASRRKSSSVVPLVITVLSVVVIVVLAGAGFYMMNKGPAAINKMGLASLAQWAGLNDSQEGSITLRATKGAFMRNSEVGEILVIRGEAVNGFRNPRASIQVKATVFGPKGEKVATKTAYCGNLITNEQIAALPMARIEAAMNNQFGDSLANLGVKPGNAIPFVIAVSGVPKEASEFGLEVAGSTATNQ